MGGIVDTNFKVPYNYIKYKKKHNMIQFNSDLVLKITVVKTISI